jgi:hypothetical protein
MSQAVVIKRTLPTVSGRYLVEVPSGSIGLCLRKGPSDDLLSLFFLADTERQEVDEKEFIILATDEPVDFDTMEGCVPVGTYVNKNRELHVFQVVDDSDDILKNLLLDMDDSEEPRYDLGIPPELN